MKGTLLRSEIRLTPSYIASQLYFDLRSKLYSPIGELDLEKFIKNRRAIFYKGIANFLKIYYNMLSNWRNFKYFAVKNLRSINK